MKLSSEMRWLADSLPASLALSQLPPETKMTASEGANANANANANAATSFFRGSGVMFFMLRAFFFPSASSSRPSVPSFSSDKPQRRRPEQAR